MLVLVLLLAAALLLLAACARQDSKPSGTLWRTELNKGTARVLGAEGLQPGSSSSSGICTGGAYDTEPGCSHAKGLHCLFLSDCSETRPSLYVLSTAVSREQSDTKLYDGVQMTGTTERVGASSTDGRLRVP